MVEYKGDSAWKNSKLHKNWIKEDKTKKDTYLFRIGRYPNTDIIINARNTKHKARFVNHSCNPNMEAIQIETGLESEGIFYKAIKKIGKDEELTIDYKFTFKRGDKQEKCLCKSENCSGILGIKKLNYKEIM